MNQPNDALPTPTDLSFESLKKLNQHGVEFWSARDLQACLGYTEWRKFKNAIKKAIESCSQSGNNPKHHLVGADKQIQFGKGAIQVFEYLTIITFLALPVTSSPKTETRENQKSHTPKSILPSKRAGKSSRIKWLLI